MHPFVHVTVLHIPNRRRYAYYERVHEVRVGLRFDASTFVNETRLSLTVRLSKCRLED